MDDAVVVSAPVKDVVPLMSNKPWLLTAALIVPPTMFNVWPDGMVIEPPAIVVVAKVIGAVMVDVVIANVRLFTSNTPGPVNEPAVALNVPPFTVNVRPEAIEIVPVFVKVGVVPVWLSVRLPVATEIVP